MLFTLCLVFFFFKQKTAYEMRISDWSSDVCSSDLHLPLPAGKSAAPFTDRQGQAQWMPAERLDQTRLFHGGAHLLFTRHAHAKGEILGESSREQSHFLRQVADDLAQPARTAFQIGRAHV